MLPLVGEVTTTEMILRLISAEFDLISPANDCSIPLKSNAVHPKRQGNILDSSDR